MINSTSIEAVAASRLNERFGKPLYDSYCFSQIPSTINHLLTGEGAAGLPADTLGTLPTAYDKVILLFVDAFGWRFFEQYADRHPFLRRFKESSGVASKLTTQFPSTTTAHMPTILSGLPVGETGLYEWFMYEPSVDRIIAPLIFSYAGDKQPGTLLRDNISPRTIFPTETVFQKLARHGVKSYAFQSQAYTPSPLSDVGLAGAQVIPFHTLAEGLVNLSDAVLNEPGKAYYFLYFDAIDTLLHQYGPGAPQVEAEIEATMYALEKYLHERLAGKAKNTLLLVTADHGQIEISPETTIYVNQFTPSVAPWIQKNRDGLPLVPAGSPRDLFLHIQVKYRDEAIAMLRGQLAGHADVFPVEELIAAGCFGTGEPTAALLARVGNVVVLPYEHESVYWYEKGVFEQKFLGHHGGLSRQEMETILLAQAY